MDEATLICDTHGDLASAHYAPNDDSESAGLCAGARAIHQARYPECVMRIVRETALSADVWREVVRYADEEANTMSAANLVARMQERQRSAEGADRS